MNRTHACFLVLAILARGEPIFAQAQDIGLKGLFEKMQKTVEFVADPNKKLGPYPKLSEKLLKKYLLVPPDLPALSTNKKSEAFAKAVQKAIEISSGKEKGSPEDSTNKAAQEYRVALKIAKEDLEKGPRTHEKLSALEYIEREMIFLQVGLPLASKMMRDVDNQRVQREAQAFAQVPISDHRPESAPTERTSRRIAEEIPKTLTLGDKGGIAHHDQKLSREHGQPVYLHTDKNQDRWLLKKVNGTWTWFELPSESNSKEVEPEVQPLKLKGGKFAYFNQTLTSRFGADVFLYTDEDNAQWMYQRNVNGKWTAFPAP